MMSSCCGGIACSRGDHDSVDKLAEFDKPIHWQLRISYNTRQGGLARHPGRKNECCTVFPSHEYVFDTVVLIPASQNKGCIRPTCTAGGPSHDCANDQAAMSNREAFQFHGKSSAMRLAG
jgi:hypothetical protein